MSADTIYYDHLPITVRGYQFPAEEKKYSSTQEKTLPPSDKWYLVFDTETLVTASQHIRFGVCHIYRRDVSQKTGHERYTRTKSYLFYDPLSTLETEIPILQDVAHSARHTLLDITAFRDTVFIPWVCVYRAYCIGFNLPFDISRIAVDHTIIERGSMQDGFSFSLSADENTPQIQVKAINTRAALYSLKYSQLDYSLAKRYKKERQVETSTPDTSEGEEKGEERPYSVKYRGRFVDVATLAHVLYSRKFSLESLCKHIGLSEEEQKEDSKGHGRHLDADYIHYAIKDVVATFECFKVLKKKYSGYNLTDTKIENLYTEASIGKGCLREMMVFPWSQCQADFNPETLGYIMSSFYGGRSEIHMRRKIVEGLYCDMLSMYPTVCTLMGLWQFVISMGVEERDDTEGVRNFLESLLPLETGLEILRQQETWKNLHAIVQILPSDDILPIRTAYAKGGDENIGINYLTSETPVWYTLPDIIDSVLLTGKIPHIVRAIRFTPKGKQSHLKPLNLLGKEEYHINPLEDDMFKKLIEMRVNIAKKKQKDATRKAEESKKSGDQRGYAQHKQEIEIAKSDVQAIKIIANATSYGVFAEINTDKFESPTEVDVYSYKKLSLTTSSREKAGKYFHPLLATLITGASRLLLGIAETLADREGLSWAFCDTDSMTLCNPQDLPQSTFIEKVERVQSWYDALNPYNLDTPDNLFKFEDYNYVMNPETGRKNTLQPLNVWCISAKRYVLFNTAEDGSILIRKASVHGLGTYLPPYGGYVDEDKTTDEERQCINPVRDVSYDHAKKINRVCVSPFKDTVPPISEEDLREVGIARWEYDLWHCILSAELRGETFNPHLYEGFIVPVRKMYSNSSPHLLKYYRLYNADKAYHDQVRPFGFYIASTPVSNPEYHLQEYNLQPSERVKEWNRIKEIASQLGGVACEMIMKKDYTHLPHVLKRKTGVDFYTFCQHIAGVSEDVEVDTDKIYHHILSAHINDEIARESIESLSELHPIAVYNPLATPGTQRWIDRDTLQEINPQHLKTYCDFLRDYDTHPEHKFSHGETGDRGFTTRRHIKALRIDVMGKEYKHAEEHIATSGEVPYGVRYDNTTSETLTPDFMESLKSFSGEELAYATNLSTSTIKRLKRDPSRVSRDTLEKVSEELIICKDEENERIKTGIKVMGEMKPIVQREGVRKVASQLGISHSSLSRLLSGKQSLTSETADKMKVYVQNYRK